MNYQGVFERYEMKYLITKSQELIIKKAIAEVMNTDEYGKSIICNIYFDTPTDLLIRNSIQRPIYKEKLRVRSYGVANRDSNVFVELKKKYKSVVYKRRVLLSNADAFNYLCNNKNQPKQSQIVNEIEYFKNKYKNLQPKMFISYEREAFYSNDDHDFRITFDRNVLWRNYNLTLCNGVYGDKLLNDNQILMEIKTTSAVPLWFARLLSENHIYKTSFSKYGNAYITSKKLKEEVSYA